MLRKSGYSHRKDICELYPKGLLPWILLMIFILKSVTLVLERKSIISWCLWVINSPAEIRWKYWPVTSKGLRKNGWTSWLRQRLVLISMLFLKNTGKNCYGTGLPFMRLWWKGWVYLLLQRHWIKCWTIMCWPTGMICMLK